MRRDERGQIHIIEVVTAALILVAAIQTIVTTQPPPASASESLIKLKELGDDSLRALDNMPLEDPHDRWIYDNSTLVKAISTQNMTTITELLNGSLPRTMTYSLSISNGTSSVHLFGPTDPIGDATTSRRWVHLKSNPYPFEDELAEVRLLIWYEVRP